MVEQLHTNFDIGPQSVGAYSRLSYTMWYALAEFIDNSTQSRANYDSIIDDVLKQEGTPLVVGIVYDKIARTITIEDNSIGMNYDDLIQALRVAYPTPDSVGRSKYGMGMKTAACWIGKRWKVVTCEWGSGKEWTAEVDVEAIAYRGARIPLSVRDVANGAHYTRIEISELNRNIQKRTEENIRGYLGSMYRHDLVGGGLKLLYGGEEILAPEEGAFDTDPNGHPMRLEISDLIIGGKPVTGWVGVLRKGAGGRKFGGFSLFQNQRQIQGFPNAWKPRSIYGGVDDEGANNLIAQRLTGVLNLDGFEVSHTKDAILFQGDEEEDLETALFNITQDYRTYASKRRGDKTQLWSREKVRDLVQSMSKEFSTAELSDTINNTPLPPLETIQANNQKQAEAVKPEDHIATFAVSADLKIIVSLQERSEYDPHLIIVANAIPNTINIVINGLHPYYGSLESSDAVDECIRQYVYDAIAEYRVHRLSSVTNPDSVRRIKDALLRVQDVAIDNAAATLQRQDYEVLVRSARGRS